MKTPLVSSPKPLSPRAAAQAARSTRRLDAIKRRQDLAAAAREFMLIRCPELSVDKLLCRPGLAVQMCRKVKRSFKDAGESEICDALLAWRKRQKKS